MSHFAGLTCAVWKLGETFTGNTNRLGEMIRFHRFPFDAALGMSEGYLYLVKRPVLLPSVPAHRHGRAFPQGCQQEIVQRDKLIAVAARCPVQRTLEGAPVISTLEAG